MKTSLTQRITILALCLAIFGASESAFAQQSARPQDPALGSQSTIPQTISPQQPVEPQPTDTAEPEENLPDAPSAQPQTTTTTTTTESEQPQTTTVQQQAPATQTNPLGTAAAEKAVTRGGAVSKPAGTAIAPVKQRQVRSFLLRLGAIAAGGVALGTIYALTKSSKSTPPNTALATP